MTAEIKLPEPKGEMQEADWEYLRNFPLIAEDGEPMESPWHRSCMNLMIEAVLDHFRDRTDFYVGGNMFVYFSLVQALNRDYRGPDFFFVNDVNLHPQREFWAAWFEGGRYPDVIIELLSPTTAEVDRTTKREIYERTFHTRNYFCYDPRDQLLEGWKLNNGSYEPLQPNEHGWLWSDVLQLWVGTWEGEYLRERSTWLRFYDQAGNLALIRAERSEQKEEEEHRRAEEEHRRAEEERRRAEEEHHRAETAEAELARLRALLAERGEQDTSGPSQT